MITASLQAVFFRLPPGSRGDKIAVFFISRNGDSVNSRTY